MNDPGANHGLTAENILAAFPVALRDDASAAALGDITARLLARRPEEISRLRIYPVIDQLPEKLLDILAYDWRWRSGPFIPKRKCRNGLNMKRGGPIISSSALT